MTGKEFYETYKFRRVRTAYENGIVDGVVIGYSEGHGVIVGLTHKHKFGWFNLRNDEIIFAMRDNLYGYVYYMEGTLIYSLRPTLKLGK